MADNPPPSDSGNPPATRDDVLQILGELRGAILLSILELKPTVRDVEIAAIWLEGDGDVLAKDGEPLSGVAEDIYDIVAAEEAEEEPPR